MRLPIVASAPDGRRVSAPTIEFRLPDGSAHPYLLLSGVAQAVVAARALPDLGALLDRTTAAHVRAHPADGGRIPQGAPEIAAALDASRAVLEAGGVFPGNYLDLVTRALRS